MALNLKNEEIILDESLAFKSILFIKKCFFLFIFSFYIIYLSKKSYEKKFEKKINKIPEVSPELNYSKMCSILETRSNTFLSFLHNLTFSHKQDKKNFFLRTFNNYFFVFPFVCEISEFIFSNNLLLIFGTKNLGYKKIKNLNYGMNYCLGLNGITVFIVFTFPYFFIKYCYLFVGIRNIFNIEFHPLIVTISSKIGFKSIWVSKKNKFSKKRKFFQICNIGQNNLESIIYNNILLNSEILFVTLKKNIIESWRITFTSNKILSNFEMCGLADYSKQGKIVSFFWGGIFSRCIFLGDVFGNIVLSNEILSPLLKIKVSNLITKDFLHLKDFSSIIMIFKKTKKKTFHKKKRKNVINLPQSILMIFSIEKNQIKTFSYILNILNFVKFKTKLISEKELIDKLNKISVFFDNFKMSKHFSKSILFLSDNLIYSNSFLYTLIFFHRLIRIIFSTFLNFFFLKKIFEKKNFIFRIFLLSKIRNLSFSEIESEQIMIMFVFKRFFYQKCNSCERIGKFLIRLQLRSYSCLFYHSPFNKNIKLSSPNNYLFRDIFNEKYKLQKKCFFFFFGTKILKIEISKKLILQKEINWLPKFVKK